MLQQPLSYDPAPPYRRYAFCLILILFVYRALLAFTLGLSNDEAYYWLYSLYPQWNYFDHPPLVAVWIRLFTANLLLDSYPGFIRLGSLLSCALSAWLLFRTAARLHSEKAGWYAVVLYNASFYAGITAGLYILPDSPQMVFWTLSLYLITRIVQEPQRWKWWWAFGISTGLCIMSKVHGVFLWTGFGCWLLLCKRQWLSRPQPWLALLLTFVIISPILFWNLRYDFATWRYHSGRVEVNSWTVNWKSFAIQLGSQVSFSNPLNFVLLVWALRRRPVLSALQAFHWIAWPLVLSLLAVSLFRTTTLPHWSGPAYVSLIPFTAVRLAEVSVRPFPRVLRWSLALFITSYTGWAATVELFPGTYGSRNSETLGQGDITLDMYGWKEAAQQFEALYREDVAAGLMPEGAPVVTAQWWGAHVEYYFCRPLQLPMIGLAPAKLGQYLWVNRERRGQMQSRAYAIVPCGDRYRVPFNYFEGSVLARKIVIYRGGRPAHQFYVYRLLNPRKPVPVIE